MVQCTLRQEGESPDYPEITINAGLLLLMVQTNHKQQNDKSYIPLSDEKRNELRCKLLFQLKFIILDEIYMVGSDMLLQIHNRLNEIVESSHPFGGISILVGWLVS